MSEKLNLKPCPFCGCEAILSSGRFLISAQVRCANEKCGASFLNDCTNLVVKLWNRRTPTGTDKDKA